MRGFQRPSKVSYHVICNEADLDEIIQDWITVSEWDAEQLEKIQGIY